MARSRPYDPKDPNDRAAAEFNRIINEQAPRVAQAMPRPPGAQRYDAADERRAFWQRDPAVDEQAIWIGAIGKVMYDNPQMNYEEAMRVAAPLVSQAVYPMRWRVGKTGERKVDVMKWLQWSDRMERQGRPSEGEGNGTT